MKMYVFKLQPFSVQIWVPTSFHSKLFGSFGNLTEDTALWTLPQCVNTTFYGPDHSLTTHDIARNLGMEGYFGDDAFIFLSVFKWEERKGWPFLLRAYLSEFGEDDNVELVILTNAYHTSSDFEEKIEEFIANDAYLSEHLRVDSKEDSKGDTEGESDEVNSESDSEDDSDSEVTESRKRLPSLHVVPGPLANELMPQLYQIANVFVLPSRGEGWGRPHVEAMSMGLGIIATGWSGPTEYIENGRNGWLIKVEEMEGIESGAFRGHQWAKPSVEHLRKLMRKTYQDPQETARVGKRAQIDMRKKYCIECIGKRLENKLRSMVGDIEQSCASK